MKKKPQKVIETVQKYIKKNSSNVMSSDFSIGYLIFIDINVSK